MAQFLCRFVDKNLSQIIKSKGKKQQYQKSLLLLLISKIIESKNQNRMLLWIYKKIHGVDNYSCDVLMLAALLHFFHVTISAKRYLAWIRELCKWLKSLQYKNQTASENQKSDAKHNMTLLFKSNSSKMYVYKHISNLIFVYWKGFSSKRTDNKNNSVKVTC